MLTWDFVCMLAGDRVSCPTVCPETQSSCLRFLSECRQYRCLYSAPHSQLLHKYCFPSLQDNLILVHIVETEFKRTKDWGWRSCRPSHHCPFIPREYDLPWSTYKLYRSFCIKPQCALLIDASPVRHTQEVWSSLTPNPVSSVQRETTTL